MVDKGCRYAMYFHYMPVGNEASVDLLLSPEQRMYMRDRVREIRRLKDGEGLFTMDFQNDGEYVGGCIAGGRNYFHINANGDAEPCVFIHYSNANIRDTIAAGDLTNLHYSWPIMMVSRSMKIICVRVRCWRIRKSCRSW